MKKRLFALLSALCLTAGCLGACGSKPTYTLPTTAPTEAPTTAPEVLDTPDATATTAPGATATPVPTKAPAATKAPTEAPTKAPTTAPVDAPTVEGSTFDFHDLTYNTSYGTMHTIEADGSISLQFQDQYQEIKLNLPEKIDMSTCKKVTVKTKSEFANLSVKLYDESLNEVFVHYGIRTNGISDIVLTPGISNQVAAIGLMAQDVVDDYSKYVATVYSITFHTEGNTEVPVATATPVPTKAPTATPVPTKAPTATPVPTKAPTATPVPTKAPTAPTKAPAQAADLTYDFNQLKYNTSYGTTYKVESDGSISLQYQGQYQEIKLDLPKTLDMSYCTGITLKLKSEAGPIAFKLYDEGYAEVYVQYNLGTSGIKEIQLPAGITNKVAGIGLMANEATTTDATVYSVTFHMKAGYDSGAATPTQAPIPTDPNDTGIWENNADISWIDPSKPMIAFTFDDGPFSTLETSAPIRIQNALRDAGQHATFFYWGSHITESLKPEIKRAYDLGFEIGNHTNTHPYLTKLTADKIYENYMACADKLTAITGLEHFLVRPPYLATNATVKETVREPMINCSIDSKDWDGATTEQILNTIRTQKKDGAIVLMHENYNTTAAAMEILIPELVAEGWQIVSVSELFKAKGLELKDGSVYNNAN